MIGRPALTLFTTFAVWCYSAETGRAHAATGIVTGAAGHSIWQSNVTMLVAGLVAAGLISLALILVLRPREPSVGERVAPFIAPKEPKLPGESGGEPGPIFALVGRVFGSYALRKRRAAFSDQLADNLQILASSMRGGQSMAGGLEIVAEEAAEPARSEFRRVVAEDRLGTPLDEAIRIVARRMENRGMEQVALVAAIQREAGGNTADVLDRVVETMRERTELQRMVKTLTAQGRISRNVVSALPALLLLVISMLNPKYIDPLIHTSTGQFMLGLCVFLVVMGFLAISRIVNIKV